MSTSHYGCCFANLAPGLAESCLIPRVLGDNTEIALSWRNQTMNGDAVSASPQVIDTAAESEIGPRPFLVVEGFGVTTPQ